MKRTVFGTVGGALVGGTLAAAISAAFVGILLALSNAHPIDHARDVERFPKIVAFSAICGVILGALAGFASRVHSFGVSFLKCCIFIAISAGVVRLLTAPRGKHTAREDFVSYCVSLLAAIIMTGILIWIGRLGGRRSPSEDRPTTHPPQSSLRESPPS